MSSANFKCSLCERNFTRNSSLRRHIRGFHSGEGTQLPSLKRGRMTTAHRQTIAFKCSTCDGSFSHRQSLSRHMRTVHGHKERHEHRPQADVQKMEFSNLAGNGMQ